MEVIAYIFFHIVKYIQVTIIQEKKCCAGTWYRRSVAVDCKKGVKFRKTNWLASIRVKSVILEDLFFTFWYKIQSHEKKIQKENMYE